MQDKMTGAELAVPIESGHAYTVADVRDPSRRLRLDCVGVQQRNWSRVGTGVLTISAAAEPLRVFLKQNIDRGGRRRPEHWHHEQTGARIARELLQNIVRVPTLCYQDEGLLLNVFEYIDVITLDELLRLDAASFDRSIPAVSGKMVQVLEAMKTPKPMPLAEVLPSKTRPYGGPSTAVNFKGFEIRNTGLVRGDGLIESEKLVMFDFVRPYLAPIEEAAAKLVVSIGLLNWGRPLARFVRGPDMLLLDRVLPVFQPYLDRRAVQAELALQFGFRTREFKGAGHLERLLKRLGTDTLGQRYLHKLAVWCERNIE